MKLGEVLVKQGLISEDMLARALEEQKKDGTKLGTTLIKLGFVKEDDLLNALSRHFGVESIDLYRQLDGSYKFRVRARAIEVVGPRDGGLALDVSMGSYRASSPLPLRPRLPGRLVFP